MIVIKKDPKVPAIDAFDDLSSNPEVEYVEPNYIYHADKIPNDPDFSKMWGFQNRGESNQIFSTLTGFAGAVAGVDINITKAWDISTGSDSVVVSVIDTGIDLTHPDLVPNLWTNEKEANGKAGVDDDGNGYVDDVHGYNFADENGTPQDGHGHGSHCAGIIGARGNDGVGIAGINWKVKLMAVKFLADDGSGTLEAAIKAINYASKMGANIMSNSWGGGSYSKALEDAIKGANKAGALFVAAAGNDGDDNDKSDHYPANYQVANVVSVAAIDSAGNLADFSNYGANKVHIAAPGVDVYSAFKDGGYTTMSGTSMATPHVSGVAALILSKEKLTVAQLKQRLISTARKIDTLKGKVASNGLLDAYAALGGK
jgi:thermitase